MNSKTYTYKYPRPSLTVDIIVFKTPHEDCEILLIQRLNPPYKDKWALPGGFMDIDETIEEAAKRELKEETSIENITLKQFKVYSALNRDPRGRTVSVVFTGIASEKTPAIAGDDAKNVCWFKINNLPEVAFDHQQIINDAIKMLNN